MELLGFCEVFDFSEPLQNTSTLQRRERWVNSMILFGMDSGIGGILRFMEDDFFMGFEEFEIQIPIHFVLFYFIFYKASTSRREEPMECEKQ